MIRYRLGVAIAAAALVASAVAMLPASPAAAAGPVNCPGGTCDISLYRQIVLGGDQGASGGAPAIALPQPPCWYIPYPDGPDAKSMATYWFGGGGPPPNDPIVTQAILQHANATWKSGKLTFNGTPDPGSWYALNGGEGNTGYMSCWTKAITSSLANVYTFVAPGAQPPQPYVPPVDLADYAANHQTIPTPTAIVNPANRGYVNLATYAWGNWPASKTTRTAKAYKTTATLGNETVTVWSVPSKFTVSASGGAVNPASNCGMFGSSAPVGHPPVTPPRTMPDCGVLPTGPTSGLNITVGVTWTRTWGVGNLNGPGPNALPPATVYSAAKTVPVVEIQSINNGSG
jgi:hypothetical protein